jgi:predicted ArsR family transcriptional regulator
VPKQKRVRSHHQVLASTSRTAVLGLLRDRAEPLGVEDVAAAVGLHVNTVRGHLDVLVDGGYAVRRTLPPRGPGRPRTVYEATAAPDDGSNYRLLAELLTRYLVETSDRPGEDALRAGRRWAAPHVHAGPGRGQPPGEGASEQVAVAEVMRLLADSGFVPELSADRSRIDLHHCPFRDLAIAHPDVVCGAHLGILQGALAEMGAPVAATRLLPLVQPDLCVATLEPRPAS